MTATPANAKANSTNDDGSGTSLAVVLTPTVRKSTAHQRQSYAHPFHRWRRRRRRCTRICRAI